MNGARSSGARHGHLVERANAIGANGLPSVRSTLSICRQRFYGLSWSDDDDRIGPISGSRRGSSRSGSCRMLRPPPPKAVRTRRRRAVPKTGQGTKGEPLGSDLKEVTATSGRTGGGALPPPVPAQKRVGSRSRTSLYRRPARVLHGVVYPACTRFRALIADREHVRVLGIGDPGRLPTCARSASAGHAGASLRLVSTECTASRVTIRVALRVGGGLWAPRACDRRAHDVIGQCRPVYCSASCVLRLYGRLGVVRSSLSRHRVVLATVLCVDERRTANSFAEQGGRVIVELLASLSWRPWLYDALFWLDAQLPTQAEFHRPLGLVMAGMPAIVIAVLVMCGRGRHRAARPHRRGTRPRAPRVAEAVGVTSMRQVGSSSRTPKPAPTATRAHNGDSSS